MAEKLLGDGTSFQDVEELRKQLAVAELEEFEREEKITALSDELYRAKAEAQYEIDQLILSYKKDKEAMKTAGFTRQDDYEKYLRNEILRDEIAEIEDRYKSIQEKIESIKHHKKLRRLRIKNLTRKLDNRKIFAAAIFQGLGVGDQIIIKQIVEHEEPTSKTSV